MNPKKEEALHAIGFQQSILKSCFKKIILIDGRDSRLEFWFWLFFILAISLLFLSIEEIVYLLVNPLSKVYIGRFIGILFLPICIRRLHDIGKTGWTIILDWITPMFITAAIYHLSTPIATILVFIFILTKIFVWTIRRFHGIENARWPFFMIDLMLHLSLFAFAFFATTIAINEWVTMRWALINILIRALVLLLRDSNPQENEYGKSPKYYNKV